MQKTRTSRCTTQEVSILFNASDVILLPSIHEGTLPISNESLACNLLMLIRVDVGDVGKQI